MTENAWPSPFGMADSAPEHSNPLEMSVDGPG